MTSTAGSTLLGIGFGLALFVPLEAAACPLCIAAQDESVQIAYMFATGFMTFLPFGLIGGFVYWLRRRARQLAFEDATGVIRLPVADARARRVA